MRRRRKPEGAVVDLTRWTEGTPFVLEELIVVAETKEPKKCFTEDWALAAYALPCEFCGQPGAHYDHINMFDKVDCVSSMILRGCSREEVETEMAKCQFLCRTCHGTVTKAEQKLGFIAAKVRINKKRRKGVDVGAELADLRVKYEEAMRAVYTGLKETAIPTLDD